MRISVRNYYYCKIYADINRTESLLKCFPFMSPSDPVTSTIRTRKAPQPAQPSVVLALRGSGGTMAHMNPHVVFPRARTHRLCVRGDRLSLPRSFCSAATG